MRSILCFFACAVLAALSSASASAHGKPFPYDYGPHGKPTASDFVINTFSGNRQRPPSTVDFGCNWNFRLKRCMPAGYPSR